MSSILDQFLRSKEKIKIDANEIKPLYGNNKNWQKYKASVVCTRLVITYYHLAR